MPYYTRVFEKLSIEKQEKIMAAAVAEFAAHGFEEGNTNQIARRAGISVGSLFQYFETKKNLFLAMVDYETDRLLAPLIGEMRQEKNVFILFRSMLEQARSFGLSYPEQNRIYLMVTADKDSSMSLELTRRLESMTIDCYKQAMAFSREENLIRSGLDDGFIAFQLDSLVLWFQFSFASDYFRERLIAYTGLDPLSRGDEIIDVFCTMVEKMLK